MVESQGTGPAVRLGCHIELEMLYENGEIESLSLDLVPDKSADFINGFLGESTPLAKTIMGQAAGSQVAYRVGDAREVRILSVSEELSAAPRDLTERRQETLRKAIRHSDHTNLVIFASSMNSKWGDYDPGVIQEDEEEK